MYCSILFHSVCFFNIEYSASMFFRELPFHQSAKQDNLTLLLHKACLYNLRFAKSASQTTRENPLSWSNVEQKASIAALATRSLSISVV